MNNPKDLNAPSSWNMRIWDCKKNQWLCDGEDDVLPYYGFDIRGGEVTAMQSMDWVYRQFEHGRKLIWERSTGLTDKNGKEIYEGDILKFIKDPEMARVVWNTPSAEFHIKWLECGVSDSLSWHLHDHGGAEVIGNIHEPPKDFRPEHLKRMGVSINKGGEE